MKYSLSFVHSKPGHCLIFANRLFAYLTMLTNREQAVPFIVPIRSKLIGAGIYAC